MSPITRAIAQARRRVFLQHSLTALGGALLAAVGGGAVLLLASRLASAPIVGAWYLILAGAAVVAAPLLAWVRRPSPHVLAALIDHRLKLKDRLATAIYAAGIRDDAFAHRVVEDAQAAATHLRIKDGFPLRLHRVWGYTAPAALVLALLAAMLPQRDLFGLAAARARRQTQQALARDAHDDVVQATALVEKLGVTDPQLKEGDTKESLQQLAELSRADLRDPEMRRHVAAKLSDVESKLAQTADARQQELQSLQNTMSRLDTPTPGPADKFADALRRGDFEAAKQELDQLAKASESMSEADKKAMAEQLKNLAEQLEQAAQDAARQQAQSQQQTQQTLQNAGLSPQQVQQLQQQGFNQQAVQQALEKQGMNPQQAQQTAQQVQQSQQQCQNSGKCSGAARSISSSLGKMSQSASQGANSSQQQQQMQQSSGQAGQQLAQAAQMQNQLQQMRQTQSQLKQATQSMCQGGGGSKTNPLGSMPKPSDREGGVGGSKAGTAHSDAHRGPERKINGYQTSAEGDIGQGEGRVIASWMENGPMTKGSPEVTFDQTITEARKQAEQAVTEDRVPQRYHEAIRDYFNQVPQSADRVAPPPAPK